MDDQFSKTAKNVFEILKGRPSMGLLDEINWAEMKNYRTLCSDRIDRLRDEIDKVHREEALKLFE